MSGNRETEIHIFTDETLRERDLRIAAKLHQATVVSTTRKLNKMNPGQVLNASRNNCEALYWSSDKLNTVLDFIDND